MQAIQSYFFIVEIIKGRIISSIYDAPDSLSDKGFGYRAAYEINNSNITEFLKLDTTTIFRISAPVFLIYPIHQ